MVRGQEDNQAAESAQRALQVPVEERHLQAVRKHRFQLPNCLSSHVEPQQTMKADKDGPHM